MEKGKIDNKINIEENSFPTTKVVGVHCQVIRRKRDIVIGSWSATKKYKCPECDKVMVRQGGLYFCEPCNLDIQFRMNIGV